jgi:hypothetical protein
MHSKELINDNTDITAELVVVWCTTDTHNLITECNGSSI